MTGPQDVPVVDPRAAAVETWEAAVNAMQLGSALFAVTGVSEGTVECRINHKLRTLPAVGPLPTARSPEAIDHCTPVAGMTTGVYGEGPPAPAPAPVPEAWQVRSPAPIADDLPPRLPGVLAACLAAATVGSSERA